MAAIGRISGCRSRAQPLRRGHHKLLSRATLRLIVSRIQPGRSQLRRVAIAVTIGVVVAIGLSNLRILAEVRNQWGEDYRFFMSAARQWEGTGSFYLGHQLAGPYEGMTGVDVLYPPPALVLFVPFVYLPSFLWWAIPLGVMVVSVAAWRPASWTWPLIALCAWYPRSESIVIWGNTSMWIGAAVALALRFAWPGVLILAKPSFLPIALIGANRRRWWIVFAAVAIAQVPALPLWTDYLTAMRNNVGAWPPPWYSAADIPFLAIPVIAWFGRTLSPGPPNRACAVNVR